MTPTKAYNLDNVISIIECSIEKSHTPKEDRITIGKLKTISSLQSRIYDLEDALRCVEELIAKGEALNEPNYAEKFDLSVYCDTAVTTYCRAIDNSNQNARVHVNGLLKGLSEQQRDAHKSVQDYRDKHVAHYSNIPDHNPLARRDRFLLCECIHEDGAMTMNFFSDFARVDYKTSFAVKFADLLRAVLANGNFELDLKIQDAINTVRIPKDILITCQDTLPG